MTHEGSTMKRDNEDAIEVTDENFGELLIEGMREALAIHRGEAEPARRVRRPMTERNTIVEPPVRYRGPRIQNIRERMGLSQHVFAKVLNASPETIKAWEQEKREPDGMALTLLEIADQHPEVLMRRVRKVGAPSGRDGSAVQAG
jgi:putative transcriptional regulator